MKGRKVILAVLATLVAAGMVRADPMPMASVEAPVCRKTPVPIWTSLDQSGREEQKAAIVRTEEDRRVPSSSSFSTFLPSCVLGFSAFGRAEALPAGSWPERGGEGGRLDADPPVQVLADRQNSLALCLYGLLGLGALRSLSCVRRLSFDGVPSWYHSGAPAQIGPSYAIAPDCLCSAPLYFVQPEDSVRDCQPQYLLERIVSLWRKSQCPSPALPARGPPPLS